MNRPIKALALFIVLTSVSCGLQEENNNDNFAYQDQNFQNQNAQNGRTDMGYQPMTNNGSNGGMRKNVIMDVQYNVPAFEFDMPSSYQLTGKVYWENQVDLYLPNSMGRIANPSQKTNIEMLPSALFKHVSGRELEMYTQQTGIRNTPLMATQQAIQRLVLGNIQKMHGNIQIENSMALPNLENDFWPGQGNPQIQNDGHMFRYTFQQNGELYKAELYAVRYVVKQNFQGAYGMNTQTLWGLGRIFEISAPAASFDQVKNEMLAIAKSSRKTQEWEALTKRIDEQKAREINNQARQSARRSAAAHQQRMANNQRNFDASQSAYKQTQQVYDNANQSWMNNQKISDQGQSNYVNSIYGTENYSDPNTGDQYQLDNPNQYNWTNGNGEVLSTDDAFYNPEQYNTGTYYQLDPQ